MSEPKNDKTKNYQPLPEHVQAVNKCVRIIERVSLENRARVVASLKATYGEG